MSTRVLCAWCNETIRGGADADDGEASHGICFSCVKRMDLFPTEDILSLSQEQLDALPLGVIELDRDCLVRRFNRTESEAAGLAPDQVLARHFFDEVAPCTSVVEFRGRVEQMMARNESSRDELDFVFRFRTGDRFVHLVFTWDAPAQRLTILVDLLGDPADHEARCRETWRA